MDYILNDENAVYYECGYSNDNCIYLSLGGESYLITDGRYAVDAKQSLIDTKLVIDRNLVEKTSEIINNIKIKKISYNPKEWDYLSITTIMSNTKVSWRQKIDLSHRKRIIKSNAEIKLLKKAAKLGSEAFDNFASIIKNDGIGMSEKELNFLAQSYMSDFGNMPLSFEPITAINQNAAKPHAHPSKKRLNKGDLLLYDGGLKYKRYCSDRTRTAEMNEDFNFKLNQKFSDKKMQKIYDIVRKSHDTAIKKAKSGMKANQIDKLAREVIEKAGYGKYFVHSTGHGVGLDIHEMPYISSKSNILIEDNMVFTIEPGIYLSDEFGVRIEDTVVMRGGRAELI